MGNIERKPDPVLPNPEATFICKTIKDDEFEKLIKRLTEIISTLASYGSLIPGSGLGVKATTMTYKEALRWYYLLNANQMARISTLIDEKLNDALSKYSRSQINAKIESIHNRIQRMRNTTLERREREDEMIPALNSCEEILILFEDENFFFWKSVVVAYEPLIKFVVIYTDLMRLILELRPSYEGHLRSQFSKISQTLHKYKGAIIRERLQKVYIRGVEFFNNGDGIGSVDHTIRGDGYRRLGHVNWVSHWDSEPPPWESFSVCFMDDEWISWSGKFEGNARDKYMSYLSNLQTVYNLKFDNDLRGLNDLRIRFDAQ